MSETETKSGLETKTDLKYYNIRFWITQTQEIKNSMFCKTSEQKYVPKVLDGNGNYHLRQQLCNDERTSGNTSFCILYLLLSFSILKPNSVELRRVWQRRQTMLVLTLTTLLLCVTLHTAECGK